MEIIIPQDHERWLHERTKDITSTDVGALFGVSPYCTLFELWHRKKGNLEVEFKENERMAWGTAIQDAIAEQISKEQGWTTRRMTEYIRLPDKRLGASFDFSIEEETEEIKPGVETTGIDLNPGGINYYGPYRSKSTRGIALLEIKNVDSLVFKNDWIVDGDNIEAPLHIEIQVQHQLLVSQRSYAYIGVLVGGNKSYLIKRTPDKSVQDAIIREAAAFWESIAANRPPSPSFEQDAGTIAKLYRHAEPGKVMDLREDADFMQLAAEYKEAAARAKEYAEKKDGLKAQMLMRIGDCEKAFSDLFTVSAGVVGPADISYHRDAYRNFRISWKKQK